MGPKKKPGLVESIHCEACRKSIRNDSKTLEIHWSSTNHKRYAELLTNKDLLEVWNVEWASNGRAFYCKTCNVELNCSFDSIEKHYVHRHGGNQTEIGGVPLVPYVENCGVVEEPMSTGRIILHSRAIKVRCVPCQTDIPNVPYSIEKHNNGNRHRRSLELSLNMGSPVRWNIKWAPGNRVCVCVFCDKELDFSFSKAKNHFVKHHMKPLEGEPRLEVSKVFRRKNFYESDEYDFEVEKESFKTIEGPLELIECVGSCVGLFKHFVIPYEFEEKLYEVALELETKGHEVQRGTKKEASRMVMYGMYNRGYCGWFKHENKSLYAKSERLVGDITHFLSNAFPLQMAQLWKNLTLEGLPKMEGVFAQTPFTGVAITKDYNCAPHLDSSDYGFGFVLWLHSAKHSGMHELSSFWLNEYKVRFKPSHASAIYYNASTTVHCTTSPCNAGMLGIALFQRRDCLTGLAKIIKNPIGDVVERFKNAKVAYEQNRDSARPEGLYHRVVRKVMDDIE